MQTRPDLYVQALHVTARFEGARRKYRLNRSIDSVRDGTMLVDCVTLLWLLRTREQPVGWNITAIRDDVNREASDLVRVPAALVVALFRAPELDAAPEHETAQERAEATKSLVDYGPSTAMIFLDSATLSCCTTDDKYHGVSLGYVALGYMDRFSTETKQEERADQEARLRYECIDGPPTAWDRFFAETEQEPYTLQRVIDWRSIHRHGVCQDVKRLGVAKRYCRWTKSGDCAGCLEAAQQMCDV